MVELMTKFLSEQIDSGQISGAQAYVSVEGTPTIEYCGGVAYEGAAITRSTLMPLLCASKALTAMAVAQLVDRGALHWTTRLCEVGVTSTVTVEQLLAHEVALAEPGAQALFWPDLGDAIALALDLVERGIAGATQYSVWLNWVLLAAVIEAVTGEKFAAHVRQGVVGPLGMSSMWVGVPEEEWQAIKRGVARLHLVRAGAPSCLVPFVGTAAAALRCAPGCGGLGTMADLGRLYESLLGYGPSLIGDKTKREMLAPRPAYDIAGNRVDSLAWGRGFARLPYMLGSPMLSPQSFGQGGADAVISFADPARSLVACVAINSLAERQLSARRNRLVVEAILESLAAPNSPRWVPCRT